MESQASSAENHVKRRINKFFGNILRKDKVRLEDQEEPSSSPQAKNKQKSKHNQIYSQWDLIEHIASEPIEEELSQRKSKHEEKIIYSDGLAYYTEETLENLNETHMHLHENEQQTEKKRRSFLKRSGSLLRRSLRRSKKQSKNEENDADVKGQETESENLSNVVQEINNALLAAAENVGGQENVQAGFSGMHLHQNIVNTGNVPSENCTSFANCEETDEIFSEKSSSLEHQICDEWNQEGRKVGLKNGLKRQASKLASKFQRTPGSVRLKPTISIESFPNTNRNRSTSFPAIDTNIAHTANLDQLESKVQKRTESFKRTLSLKQAKKVMRKGVASFGKSMMHASAVMPIAYESPPVTFYPDYENDFPPHLVQCYYRTISYQPKDCNGLNDKAGHQYGHYTRPTSFYQHGYCYNG